MKTAPFGKAGGVTTPVLYDVLQLPRYRQSSGKVRKTEKDITFRHNLCFFLRKERQMKKKKLKRADTGKFSAFYLKYVFYLKCGAPLFTLSPLTHVDQ